MRDTIERKIDFVPRSESGDTEAADAMLADALRSMFGGGALAVALLQLEGASEKNRDGWVEIIRRLRDPSPAAPPEGTRDIKAAGE